MNNPNRDDLNQSVDDILELLGGEVRPFWKDPFYGPLFRYLRKKERKSTDIQARIENDSFPEINESKYEKNGKYKDVKEKKPPSSNATSRSSSPVRQPKRKSKTEKVKKRKHYSDTPIVNGDIVKKLKLETAPEIKPNLNINYSSLNTNSQYSYVAREADQTVKQYPFINPAFRSLVHINTHPNGKATSLHTYTHEVQALLDSQNLTAQEKFDFLDAFYCDFAKLAVAERHQGEPYFVMSVMHGEAAKIPDPLLHYARNYGNIQVKMEQLGNAKDVKTMKLKDYFRKCRDMYNSQAGNTKCGPMRTFNMANPTGEEVGVYCREYIEHLEKVPILKYLLPWGEHSKYFGDSQEKSTDGPIMWVRPGEQLHSSTGDSLTLLKRNRMLVGGENGLRGGSQEFIKRRKDREKVIDDSTLSHADHVEEPHLRQVAWAVGLLKHTDYCKRGDSQPKRSLKKTICFDARSFLDVVKQLELNIISGTPTSQCSIYVDQQKLNNMRSLGIKYSEVELFSDDIYIIPRSVVHQFRTIGHCTSLAWHVRLKGMHLERVEEWNSMNDNIKRLYLKRQKQLINVFENEKQCFLSSEESSEESEEEEEEEEEEDSTSSSSEAEDRDLNSNPPKKSQKNQGSSSLNQPTNSMSSPEENSSLSSLNYSNITPVSPVKPSNAKSPKKAQLHSYQL